MSKKRKYVSYKLLALLFLVIIIAYGFFQIQKINRNREAYIEAHQIYPEDYYRNVNILAKAAYVFDYTDQKPLFEMHEDLPRPIASLAKLMSVPLSLELLSDNATVAIPEKMDLESASDYVLRPGIKWNSLALADFTILGSSDVGAQALQNAANTFLKNTNSPQDFVDMMNARAFQLGLLHTNFLNGTGLDISPTTAGAVGTAHDMLTLAVDLFPKYSDLFSQTIKSSGTFDDLSGRPYTVVNTDTALPTLSSVILSKTGYTNLAGGNLLIIYQSHGKTIGICVLGSTFAGRFSDAIALKNATETYLNALK